MDDDPIDLDSFPCPGCLGPLNLQRWEESEEEGPAGFELTCKSQHCYWEWLDGEGEPPTLRRVLQGEDMGANHDVDLTGWTLLVVRAARQLERAQNACTSVAAPIPSPNHS